ncbi:MAG TPA: glutaredoxin family protein [Bacillota bacterium]|nr:glutaredoxin family protein [Bacillota bacterium]
MSVIVYTTNHCPECTILKKFLQDYQIEFVIRNCSQNPSFSEEINQLGFLGVPITLVNGKAIQGFKPHEIIEALEAI